MPGVTIGDELVIGAGAVAADDVPSHGILLAIRHLSSGIVFRRDRGTAARDPLARLAAARSPKSASLMQSPDIGTFIETAEAGRA